MRYWWVAQGDNFQHVARTGNLWTCPDARGFVRKDRELMNDMTRGDWVFHYGRGYLRAISEVSGSWRHHKRPRHYEPREGEGDDGWLVPTTPTVLDLEIPYHALADVIAHGEASGGSGPLDRNGSPKRIFLAELTPGDAAGVIQLVDDQLSHHVAHAETTSGTIWAGQNSSVLREALARREQSALRDHLLDGYGQATCALCGRRLPAELLVAAHILPRRFLDEAQRKDLSHVAMLACVLGCDELFERGYLVVDDAGIVRDLTAPGLADVSAVTSKIAGRQCAAFSKRTASTFASHRAQFQHTHGDG